MTTSEDEKAADLGVDEVYADVMRNRPMDRFYSERLCKACYLAGIEYGRKNPRVIKSGDEFEIEMFGAKLKLRADDKIPPNEIHLYDPKGSLKIVDVYADKPSSPSSALPAKTDREK